MAQSAPDASGGAAAVVQQVREYRVQHEGAIVRELAEFLAIPNVASDEANIQKNAARLVEMLKARGVETELLPIAGRGPVVFGKLMTPGAKRTVIFYAHYDGQPVDAAAWTDGKPFEPALRDNSIEAGGKRIPFPDARRGMAGYKDDWRIYARSASDDKSPIVAILAAIDALRAQKIPIGVNVKMIFEGEEEAGSTNLERTLASAQGFARRGFAADLRWAGTSVGTAADFFWRARRCGAGCDGVWAGAGAAQRALWKLGAESGDGVVATAGIDDGCEWARDDSRLLRRCGAAERAGKRVAGKMPDNDAELARELGIAKPDGGGKKLVELLQQPSLNIRGLNSAYVGTHAQNVVPDKAEASIDARLVKGEDPRKKSEQIVGFIRAQGYFVVDHEPTMDERRAHALIAKIVDEGGYRASRTAMDLPVSKAMIALGAERDGWARGDCSGIGRERADVHL